MGPGEIRFLTPDQVATEGRLAMMFDFNVSMFEVSTWAPERITAFFDGIALAMRARFGTSTRFTDSAGSPGLEAFAREMEREA